MLRNLFNFAVASPERQVPHAEVQPFNIVGLPQELIDTVVDFLHDDRPTLRSASFAHRALRPAAIYHLFGLLSVDVGPSRLAALKATLSRAPRDFTTGVRILRLVGDRWYDMQEADVALFAKFHAVTSLNLHTVSFAGSNALFRLLSDFSNLMELQIEGWLHVKHDEEDDRLSTIPHMVRLQKIALERDWNSTIEPVGSKLSYLPSLQWIGSHGTVDSLQNLQVRWEIEEDMEATRELLDWEAPQMVNLCVQLRGVLNAENFSLLLSKYPIRSTSPITSLTIAVDGTPLSMDGVMRVLAETALPLLHTLRILTVGRFLKRQGRFMPLQISPPGSSFEEDAFPELQRIELIFEKISEVVGMVDVRASFTGAERRGVVLVTKPEDMIFRE